MREWKAFCDLEEGKIGYKLTQGQVKSIIFRYIFVYYNRIRISSVNPGEISPVTYREWAEANSPDVAAPHQTNAPAHISARSGGYKSHLRNQKEKRCALRVSFLLLSKRH